MVTSLSSNNMTAPAIAQLELERNVLFDPNWSELSGHVNEARRLPEVTDDDSNSGSETLLSPPTVDAWKATIKDHKVIEKLFKTLWISNSRNFLISRKNWLSKTRFFIGIRMPLPIPLCARIRHRLRVNLVPEFRVTEPG